MGMALKKIIEMEIPFGTPIEITMTNRSRDKHLGYYHYTHSKNYSKDIKFPALVYQTENGPTDVPISKIKEISILYRKE
jgi:hypothetical protein